MSQLVEINENDRKSLECPICKNLVNVPKVIRCSHVFCESCLTDYLEHSECNAPPCPVCRVRIVLPQVGMQGFRTEQFYHDIAERLKEKDELNKNKRTGVCGLCQETSELVAKCLTCSRVICKQCLPSHNSLKPHCTVVNLSEIDSVDEDELMAQRKLVCDSHDTELLNLYCHDCNKVVCFLCKVTDHVDHKCEHLNKLGAYCRNGLKTLQDEITTLVEEANVASRNVTTIYGEFLEDLQVATYKVNNTIDMFISELDVKREQFLDDIEGKREEIKSRLKRQKNKVEKVKTDGQLLIEMTRKATSYGNDADVVTLHNDLQQQINALKSDLHSSLHKDFRIKVDLNEDKFRKDCLKRTIDQYAIGNMFYSQQVAVKALKDTTMQPCDQSAPYAAVASTDSLCIVYQMKRYLYTDYTKLIFKDTYDQTEEVSIDCSKQFYGKYTSPDINEHLCTNVRCYNPLRAKKGKEQVWIQDNNIYRACDNGEIELIPLTKIKDIKDVDINAQGEILLVREDSDRNQSCSVIARDGTRKFEKNYVNLLWLFGKKKPTQKPHGSFNKRGNLLITTCCISNDNEIYLLDVTTGQGEELIMPLFENEPDLEPGAVYEKCDGLLYITVNNGSKILTVSYLS